MIDFRYHLVSTIAVLLALAVGIVVGATALDYRPLAARSGSGVQDQRSLDALVRDLRAQVARQEQFATIVGPAVLAGTLTGERVLVVTTPGASKEVVKDLTTRLGEAGATATGVLRLGTDLLDPAKSAVVDDLVARVAPSGLTLPESSVADRAALELAAATVTSPAASGISSDAAAKILGGFTGADLVGVQQPAGGTGGTTLAPATLAVLVTGAATGKPLDDQGQRRQQAALSVIRAMDGRSRGAIVAGPESAAGVGGLIAAVRTDARLSDRVSSVDSVERAFGAVSAMLALREQAAGGSGSYGQGPGAEAAAPRFRAR